MVIALQHTCTHIYSKAYENHYFFPPISKWPFWDYDNTAYQNVEE